MTGLIKKKTYKTMRTQTMRKLGPMRKAIFAYAKRASAESSTDKKIHKE